VVIDSIQTVGLPELGAAPGNITQIRECTLRLLQWAKGRNVPVFIVGHVTKSGDIAGPKALEHIVDIVLYSKGLPSAPTAFCAAPRTATVQPTKAASLRWWKEAWSRWITPPGVHCRTCRKRRLGIVPIMEGNRPLLVEYNPYPTLPISACPAESPTAGLQSPATDYRCAYQTRRTQVGEPGYTGQRRRRT